MTNETQTSVVGSCDATSCRFNQNNSCTAGQIEVTFTSGAASCATFSPSSDSANSEQPGAKS